MFSFLRTITNYLNPNGEHIRNENIDDKEKTYLRYVFNDEEVEDVVSEPDVEPIVNGFSPKKVVPNGVKVINGMNGTNGVNGFGEDCSSESDDWNEEWDAFEENVDKSEKQILDLDSKCVSIRGVVTKVIDNCLIVVDDKHQIKYQRCSFGEPFVGDLVNIETNGPNEVSIKPLRYKILTGKVTDFEEYYKRFIFAKYAFMRKTAETQHLNVGDVIKVLVLETRTNQYNWRAIPYNQVDCTDASNVDQIEAFTDELMQNKNCLQIIDKISFGDMTLKSKKSIIVWIKNKGTKSQTFLTCDQEEGDNQIQFKSFQSIYGQPSEPPFVIPARMECFVELFCEAKYCGDTNELIVFAFEGFKIGRFISVTIHDYNSGNQFARTNRCDANQYRRRMFGDDSWVVPGEKVWIPSKHIYDRLNSFRIPEGLWRALENNWNLETVFPQLKEPLNKLNYQKKFHALVYLEECENQLNLRNYDMKEAALRREGRYLALTVPGLADGRPSLIVSDKILVFDDNNKTEEKRMAFEGFIHQIRKDEILLRFNEDFHRDFRGGTFKVMFQMGRTLYRRCHHAIDLSPHMVEQVLFPSKVILKMPYKRVPIESINWFNPSLNIQQKLAVVGALRGESRPTPYIIFGPPGTGKTVTVVESILQVFDKIPHSRIIACTSANSAADLIALKLLESGRITEKDLIRITALHRVNSIPESVQLVTKTAEEDEKTWLYYRVIVTTTSQAGIVFKHKVSPSHFTHAFVDEAAQVMEPESLIPISMSAIGHGVIVLAGDHQQLGPVVQSLKAKASHLDRSLLERLMTCAQPYERDDSFAKYGFYNPKFVTKLLNNYRSDPKIMTISSKLFYENELKFVNETDGQLIDALNFKSAINFTGVRGEDRQDPDCPSWYNPQEIIQACSYLDLLYQAGVKPIDIGIITPYRKQVLKIRTHIHDMGLEECKVATIEEFQGLEKRVIIVSMVRSSQQNLDHDIKYNLGFVHNSKRFNVAVSRAMALLICIGDPYLLGRDKCWQQLIDYCLENDSYSGCAYREFVPNYMTRRRSKIMA